MTLVRLITFFKFYLHEFAYALEEAHVYTPLFEIPSIMKNVAYISVVSLINHEAEFINKYDIDKINYVLKVGKLEQQDQEYLLMN